MINHKFSLESAFQDILYRIDNWTNEGSGWIVELIKFQYINISNYRPLLGSLYIQKITCWIKKIKKGLINIKNNDQKYFLWFHVKPITIHPEGITREDKKLVNNLNYDGVGFAVWENNFSKI